ncbi:SDR family oxidoreductase [soil metagenome]
MTSGRLEGKLAIVTGAAKGAGAASASLFAREGAEVVLVDIDDVRGEAVAHTLTAEGRTARFLHCDVANEDEICALAAIVVAEHRAPDILFNHAGTVEVRKLIDTSLDDWERQMRTNVTSMFVMSREFLPPMIAAGGGVILNTSSISGFTVAPLEAVYCVSKGAILQLTRSIAVEYRADGIRCNAICPGFMRTDHGLKELADLQSHGDPISLDAVAQTQGRMCEPEEFASVALNLVSDETSFINGSSVVVDNGSTVIT